MADALDLLENEDDITTNNEPAVSEPKIPVEPPAPKDDDLRRTMTELASTVRTLATPKEPTKEKSPQELAEEWGIYNPEASRKDFFQKFFRLNPDATPAEISEAKEIFADMHKGLVRQAVVAARNILKQEMGSLREEMKPLGDYVSSQRAEQLAARFYKSFPAFSEILETGDRKYARALDAAARTLADKDFPDEKAYFQALSEEAAGLIKIGVPDFDPGAKTQTKTPAGNNPRLPRTSVGGTGGSGGGGGGKQPAKTTDDDSASLDWA